MRLTVFILCLVLSGCTSAIRTYCEFECEECLNVKFECADDIEQEIEQEIKAIPTLPALKTD